MDVLNTIKAVDTKKLKKYNTPPGTLTYAGEYKDTKFHGDLFVYNSSTCIRRYFDTYSELIEELTEFNTSGEYNFWINVIGLNDIEELRKLGEYFNISKLYMEDIVHVSKHNKIEVSQKTLFSSVQMIYLQNEKMVKETLSMYFTEPFVITFQERDGDVFGMIRDRLTENLGLIRRQRTEYLCYLLFDALVDNYMIVLNHLSYTIDDLEEMVIDSNDIDLNEIHKIKKQLLHLKTTITPLSNIKDLFKYDNLSLMTREMEPYLNDLKDHIDQLTIEITLEREIINSLFETHMLNVSNDMNKIMTTLTIYSAIFIPLSFLAGVFGMNFKHIPGLDQQFGFYVFLVACFGIAIGMILFFKIKKWF